MRFVCVFDIKCIVSVLVKFYGCLIHITVFDESRLFIGIRILRLIIKLLSDFYNEIIFVSFIVNRIIEVIFEEVVGADTDCGGSVCLIIVAVLGVRIVIGNIDTRSDIIYNDNLFIFEKLTRVAGFIGCSERDIPTEFVRNSKRSSCFLTVFAESNVALRNNDIGFSAIVLMSYFFLVTFLIIAIINCVGIGKVIHSGSFIFRSDSDSHIGFIESESDSVQDRVKDRGAISNLQIIRRSVIKTEIIGHHIAVIIRQVTVIQFDCII